MAIAAAIIGSVVSAGLAYAMAPEQPDAPDLARASRGGIEAEAETLAQRRAMEAAAQQGGTAVKSGYTRTTVGAAERDRIQSRIEELEQVRSGNMDRQRQAYNRAQNQIAALRQQLAGIPEGGGTVYVNSKGQYVPESEALVSFEGYGEADVQGKVARQMAEIELELSRKYGKDFVEEARKQLELADPTGAQARQLMYDLVQKQIENEPDRPVADLLDTQVGEQLRAGRGLDGMSAEMLAQAVREATSSRGGSDGTDFSEDLTTGFEGQRRLDAGQQKALGWLTSGATPEDVDYRREQQNLANLAAFTSGRTPQSQFQTLSGAQRGATPNMPGQALAQPNPNAGAAGASAAMQGWGTRQNAALNTASGWMTGLSAMLGVGNVAGAAGWKPLAQTA